MKTSLLLVVPLVLSCAGCKKEAAPASAPSTNQASSGNPITAPVDYLGAVGQAKKFSEKTINLVTLNSAIQQFNAIEERFPTSLNELVEKHYLPAVPALPAGMKLAYNPQTGEVRVLRQQ